jgi:hypothetical protein
MDRREFLVGASAVVGGIYLPLPFGRARAATNGGTVTYQWQLCTNALAAALNQKDGIGLVVDGDNEVFAVGGWQLNGTRHNIVSRSPDGYTFTPSAQAASFPPTHATPALMLRGRLCVFGGDQNGSGYHNHIHSWSTSESEAWVDHGSFAFLDRVGHFAFKVVIGGEEFALIGGGQTVTAFTAPPTKFFNDLWMWDGTNAPTLLYEDAPYQYRGYISSIAQMNGETALIGGGNYETSDTTRGYRTDSLKLTADMGWRLPTPRNGSNLPGTLYANTAAWDNLWWHFGGHNGGDHRAYRNSGDLKNWTTLATPPWAGRHAAVLFPFKGALYYGTGAYATDMWRLIKPDPLKQHLGSPVNSATNMGATYTVLDGAQSLTAGATVTALGFSGVRSRTMVPKIAKQTGAGTFDIVWSGAALPHPGGGYIEFLIPPFVVPDDGATYRMGWAFSYVGGADSFSTIGSRFMKAGDVTGTGQVFSTPTDGTFAMSWTEGA